MNTERLYHIVKDWYTQESDDSLKQEMGAVMDRLEAEMRQRLAKVLGVADIVKAAEKIVKAAKEGDRDSVKGMWQSGGKWCICDEKRGVRFNDEMPLEKLDEQVKPLDIDRIFDLSIYNATREIKLPDLADLKLWDKTHKPEGKKPRAPYLLDASIPLYVDVKFLICMMECLPDARVKVGGSRDLLYFSAENGDGLLCPVRVVEKSE